jgi:delta24(24(1))-sterol reductase
LLLSLCQFILHCKTKAKRYVFRDIYFEKEGFMLIFWNMAGVPLSYCHCTLHLANNLSTTSTWTYPSLRTPTLIFLFTSYLFIYWIWDTTGSQKNRFRAQERGHLIIRKTFPQLPYATLSKPHILKTASGDTLLADGWYKYARKIHYTCDAYFAITWAAVTGFESPFPWFYPLFFTVMILHRAGRDVSRCTAKYGETWVEYERLCPWLFIPVCVSLECEFEVNADSGLVYLLD